MNQSCRSVRNCLTTQRLLFKLFSFLSQRGSKCLHICLQRLKLRPYIFIGWNRCFTVNWRNPSSVLTAFKVLISVCFVRKEVNLFLVWVFFIDHNCWVPGPEIVLCIQDVAHFEWNQYYTILKHNLRVLGYISLELRLLVNNCFFYLLTFCEAVLRLRTFIWLDELLKLQSEFYSRTFVLSVISDELHRSNF